MAKNSKHTMRRVGAVMGAVAVAVVLMASARNDFALGRNIEVLINMMRELHVLYVDETDPAELMKNAAEGMTSTLDPYTAYMPEKEVAEFEMMTTGKYGGVGSLIRQKGDYVRFAEPYKGRPADRAGIKIGDRILEIDGVSAKGMTVDQVSNRLKGDPETEVRLKVARLVDDSVMNLTLRRERIAISGVQYAGWLNDSIGYIAHADFSEGCAADLRRANTALRYRSFSVYFVCFKEYIVFAIVFIAIIKNKTRKVLCHITGQNVSRENIWYVICISLVIHQTIKVQFQILIAAGNNVRRAIYTDSWCPRCL